MDADGEERAERNSDPALLSTAGLGSAEDLRGAHDGTLTGPAAVDVQSRRTHPLHGKQLAHYLVGDEIGRGGMGVVYRAHDLALDRVVALKVLPGDFAATADHRERFYREARAQARVNHPNVCHIYYVGVEDDQLFFAMELVEGQSVAELVTEHGTLPAPRALDIVRQAALGLREAQKHGIVHRDVKPSNLMVNNHGVVKVMDFGIAAHADHVGDAALGAGAVEQTSFAGTPLFSAPEQLLGQPVDHRADIYALGATLHQLLAGSVPFEAPTVEALTEMHRSELRPRFERRVLGKRDLVLLDQLTDRMMAKLPAERFRTYDELLESVEFAEPSASRPARFGIRFMAFAVDALLIVILVNLVQVAIPDGATRTVMAVLGMTYSILLLGRFGTTAGRWLLGIEVTNSLPGRGIGFKAATVRCLWQLGPLVFLLISTTFVGMLGINVLKLVVGLCLGGAILLNIIHVAVASFRSSAARTFWDRRAGTQVRYLRVRGVDTSTGG